MILASLLTVGFISAKSFQLDVELPAVGDIWKTTITQEFYDSGSGEFEQSFTYNVEKKVLERIRGGLKIESRRTMIANKLGDTDLPMPPGLEPLIETYTVDQLGLRTTLVEGGRQQQEQRLAQLTDILCPIRFGQNDSNAFKRNLEEADALKETRLEFTKGGWDRETKRFSCSLTVSDSGWKKPIEAQGEAVYPEDSAIPISMSFTAKGVEMPGGSGDTYTLKVKLARAEKAKVR